MTRGLTPGNRGFIVGIIAAALLLFGPTDFYGFAGRAAYLLGIPLAAWFILQYVAGRSAANLAFNDRFRRVLQAGIGGILLAMAFSNFTVPYHAECDGRLVQSGDFSECLGEYVPVPGPDLPAGFIVSGFAALAFWLAIFGEDSKT